MKKSKKPPTQPLRPAPLAPLAFETSDDVARHLAAVESYPFEARSREEIRALNIAPAPGYYVSAEDDSGRRILCEGPFVIHAEALVAIGAISRAWGKVDIRAPWYAWGTARVHP